MKHITIKLDKYSIISWLSYILIITIWIRGTLNIINMHKVTQTYESGLILAGYLVGIMMMMFLIYLPKAIDRLLSQARYNEIKKEKRRKYIKKLEDHYQKTKKK